jgi:hypothetical protein
MPLKFPINWNNVLIENDGRASKYLQRIFDMLLAQSSSDTDASAAALFPSEPVTPAVNPDQFMADVVLRGSLMMTPSPQRPLKLDELLAFGYWVPVTDATDPMDPAIVIDSFGQIVMTFVPTQ